MIFSSRKRGGADSHILWKIRLFFAGSALALLGMGLESSLLVILGIAVLLLGAGLRFFPGDKDEADAGESEEEEDLHEN
jgi:hypothetical protein